MDQGARAVLESLDETLQKLQEQEVEGVRIEPFRKLLSEMLAKLPQASRGAQPVPDPAVQLEYYKAQLSIHGDSLQRDHEWSIKQYEIVLSSASMALKTGMLLSGGAAIAMMSFASNMVTKKSDLAPAIGGISDSVVAFFIAVFLAAFATAGTYFAQYCYSQKNYQKPEPEEQAGEEPVKGNPDPIRSPGEIWDGIKAFAKAVYVPKDYQRRGDQVRILTWCLGIGSYVACALGGWFARSAIEIALALPNAS